MKNTIGRVGAAIEWVSIYMVRSWFRPIAFWACHALTLLMFVATCVIAVALTMPGQLPIANDLLLLSSVSLFLIGLLGPILVALGLFVHQTLEDEKSSPLGKSSWWLIFPAIACVAAGVFHHITEQKVRGITDLRFVVSDHEVSWCGDVPVGAVDRLAAALRHADGDGDHPPRRLTMVENGGGEVIEVRRFLDRREELGISEVMAVGRCLSACALIWAGSPDASIERQSALGFHGAFNNVTGDPAPDLDDLKIIDQILSLDRGFDEGTLRGWLRYGPAEMAMLGVADLQALGIRHEVVDRGPSFQDRCGTAGSS